MQQIDKNTASFINSFRVKFLLSYIAFTMQIEIHKINGIIILSWVQNVT